MGIEKVFVVDAEGKPLLPTHSGRARKLLKDGKAVVEQMIPFTIRLNRAVASPVGSFTLGIDDGAKEVGLAVVDEERGEVVFQGVVQLRQDVSRKMAQRKAYRSARRFRKTRYRQCRPYRKKGAGWLSPTIRQKKDSIVRTVIDLRRRLPITAVVVEQGEFDTASLAAGRQLQGEEYQIPNYAGRDFRAKVLWRDGYTCQHCGSDQRLQAHHIRFRSEGGSDSPDNGLTLCKACHESLHRGEWLITTQPRQFKYPAHLQTGKHYLTARLAKLGVEITVCFGWMTHYWRTELGLDKSHIHDAVAMVCRAVRPTLCSRSYLILPKRKKVWDANPTKKSEEKHGFRHWDVVKAQHRTRRVVIGSVRSLKANEMTLRTSWDDNFPVSYSKSKLLWRFNNLIYIEYI